jgi:hypothetical protein
MPHLDLISKYTKKTTYGCLLFAWQRPTLTGTCVPTTIGAEKLNFRVRYGNGCDLLAIATRLILLRFIPSKLDNTEEVKEERVHLAT